MHRWAITLPRILTLFVRIMVVLRSSFVNTSGGSFFFLIGGGRILRLLVLTAAYIRFFIHAVCLLLFFLVHFQQFLSYWLFFQQTCFRNENKLFLIALKVISGSYLL